MRKDVKVTLLYSDIVKATPGDYNNCMHKRAIARAIPEATHVKVKGREISLSIPDLDTRFTFATPKAAHESLKMFDKVGPDGSEQFVGMSYWLHFDEAVAVPMKHLSPAEREKARDYTAEWERARDAMSPEERTTSRTNRIKHMTSVRSR